MIVDKAKVKAAFCLYTCPKAQLSSESHYSAYWQFPPPQNLYQDGQLVNDNLSAVFAGGFTCVVCLGFFVVWFWVFWGFFGGWAYLFLNFKLCFWYNMITYDF